MGRKTVYARGLLYCLQNDIKMMLDNHIPEEKVAQHINRFMNEKLTDNDYQHVEWNFNGSTYIQRERVKTKGELLIRGIEDELLEAQIASNDVDDEGEGNEDGE